MEAVTFLRNGLGLLRFNLPRGKIAYFNHRSVLSSPLSLVILLHTNMVSGQLLKKTKNIR